MAVNKNVLFILNPDSLVAGTKSAPKIIHSGITLAQLSELRGCVRKSDPNEFWHASGSLEQWVGQQVLLVLKKDGTESGQVLRIIESIHEKSAEEVNGTDLEETLAEIAMREMSMTFLQFFREVHGGHDLAMVIRVREP